MKTALFLMLDQYADWEASYLASQLNQSTDWQVKTTSTTPLVTSIGGFTTKVDYQLDCLPTIDLLILIGGNSWNINNSLLYSLVQQTPQCLKTSWRNLWCGRLLSPKRFFNWLSAYRQFTGDVAQLS